MGERQIDQKFEPVEGAVDILILSNGPGELATWVKPVVKELRERLGDDRSQVRISVVLSPCANASGQEVAIARRYPEVDRVQAPDYFFPFLLWGKTADQWDWRSRGVVLFLGGDQFFPVIIGKRLGYRIVIYAEWEARWHAWVDRFGVMRPEIASRANSRYAPKFAVVGDLMAEAGASERKENGSRLAEAAGASEVIGLLPGSKAAKLSLGVPLTLAIAERVHQVRPHLKFVIPVAPTLELTDLVKFSQSETNPVISRLGWAAAELVVPERSRNRLPYLQTKSGLQVELCTEFPAYQVLSQCSLCLTTVGANTAELGALAVPMLVLLPTQQMDIMRAWDGLPGLLANLPGVGSSLAKVINWLALQRMGLLAWPNIWAKEEIVPELVGPLKPAEIAAQVLDFLDHPEKLEAMRTKLRSVRGQPGAAAKLVQLVCETL